MSQVSITRTLDELDTIVAEVTGIPMGKWESVSQGRINTSARKIYRLYYCPSKMNADMQISGQRFADEIRKRTGHDCEFDGNKFSVYIDRPVDNITKAMASLMLVLIITMLVMSFLVYLFK